MQPVRRVDCPNGCCLTDQYDGYGFLYVNTAFVVSVSWMLENRVFISLAIVGTSIWIRHLWGKKV